MPTLNEVRQQYPQYNDMSDGQLADALHSKFYSDMPRSEFDAKVGIPATAPASMSALEKAAEPITSYPSTYGQMERGGRERMAQGYEQSAQALADPHSGEGALKFVKGVGNMGLGGLEFATSPIMAGLRTVLGKPVEENTGIPKEYTEFAGSLALPGIGMTRIPAAAIRPAAVPQQIGSAAERLSATGAPVTVPRAAASDSMIMQQTGKAVTNIPIAGDPLIKASERTLSQLGSKADEVASGFGSGSVTTGGDAARTGVVDWITGKSAEQATKLYDKVDTLINPAVTTDLNATRNVVADIANARTQAGLPPGKAVTTVLDAVQRPGGLTYEGIKTLRTNIGEKLKSGILPEDMSGADLKKIYGGLTQDLKASVANAGGPNASTAFDRANRYYGLISERRAALAKIVGADGNAPVEQVFDRLLAKASSSSRADIASLAQARKAMGGDSWGEVASGVISRLGRDVEGNFSPERFVTGWGKISDAGKGMLFRSTGQGNLASYLDDIATISSRFKQLQKFANPSGTARAGFAGVMGVGGMASPLTTLKLVVGGRALAMALARPATAAPIAQWSRSYQILAAQPTPARMATLTVTTRNLANTLADKLGVNISPADFLRQMQGPMRAPAENEQP